MKPKNPAAYRQYIKAMRARRARMLKLREKETLAQIGARFGISRQRVLQILHGK